jgi:hypothetical protein
MVIFPYPSVPYLVATIKGSESMIHVTIPEISYHMELSGKKSLAPTYGHPNIAKAPPDRGSFSTQSVVMPLPLAQAAAA